MPLAAAASFSSVRRNPSNGGQRGSATPPPAVRAATRAPTAAAVTHVAAVPYADRFLERTQRRGWPPAPPPPGARWAPHSATDAALLAAGGSGWSRSFAAEDGVANDADDVSLAVASALARRVHADPVSREARTDAAPRRIAAVGATTTAAAGTHRGPPMWVEHHPLEAAAPGTLADTLERRPATALATAAMRDAAASAQLHGDDGGGAFGDATAEQLDLIRRLREANSVLDRQLATARRGRADAHC